MSDEGWIDLIVRLDHSIYYRKFNNEIAEEVVDYYRRLDLFALKEMMPELIGRASLPYSIMATIESYREYASDAEGTDKETVNKTIEAIERLARMLIDILAAKARGEATDLRWTPREIGRLRWSPMLDEPN